MDHGANSGSTHQIFFDNEDDCANFEASEYFETEKQLLKNKTNRLRTSQLQKVRLTDNEEEIKKLNTEKKIRYKTLSEKINNVQNLNKISNALDYQKHLLVHFI